MKRPGNTPGVFQRFPDLKFVITETGCAWPVPELQRFPAVRRRRARPCASAPSGKHDLIGGIDGYSVWRVRDNINNLPL